MSGLCRDCRFWDRDGYASFSEWLGDCRLTIMRGQEPLYPESKSRAYADAIFDNVLIPEDLRTASLQTVGDFGCNQFEVAE